MNELVMFLSFFENLPYPHYQTSVQWKLKFVSSAQMCLNVLTLYFFILLIILFSLLRKVEALLY